VDDWSQNPDLNSEDDPSEMVITNNFNFLNEMKF